MKLDEMKIALAAGITFAFCIFLTGLSTMLFNWGAKWVWILGTVYIGYKPTILGSIIGAIWAFVDAFILVYIFAWIYNKLLKPPSQPGA